MRRLQKRISMGDEWAWLALSEAQAPEESLARANAQLHCPITPQPLSQALTIPEISRHAFGPRRWPQNPLPGLSPSTKPDNPPALKRPNILPCACHHLETAQPAARSS